jgi:hypothetical protein
MAKQDHHWTFGKYCHISFPNGGAPQVEAAQAFASDEGCATYSGGNGQLTFYTDGQGLWDGNHQPVPSPPLGGSQSSAHSAIIVPPAGGGSLYHVFAVHDVTAPGPVRHTKVSATGAVTLASPPTPLPSGPKRATERLAATSHKDCNNYWVIAMEVDGTPPAPGRIFSMLVDSDAGVSTTHVTPYPFKAMHAAYTCKFSPDGSLFAVTSITSVEILKFDRSTGAFTAHSQIYGATGNDILYGVEFSPNGKCLYLSGLLSGEVRRHDIGAPGGPNYAYSSTALVGASTDIPHGSYRLGALQLGPNGKIYGAKVFGSTLLEIGNPDSPTAAGAQFAVNAAQAGGGILTLPNQSVVLGLPTFTRIADDCRRDRCAELADQVNQQLAQVPKVNTLRPCDKEQPIEKPPCRPIEMPRIAPWTSIRWGDSKCDCIEGDDTEVMNVTVCNPYSNLTLSNLTIQQIVVVDSNGNPPALLPDGSPSVQLVPIGPYCFGDLAPCTCITRQFVLRLRGAVPGPYRILLRGICFDACFHGDEDDCFVFEVCKV